MSRNRTMQLVGSICGALALILIFGGLGYVLVTGNWEIARFIFVAALALLVIFVWLNPEGIARAVTGRGARYGTNALLRVLAAVGIAVLLYAIWGLLGPRLGPGVGRIDVTANKQYTLSDLTIRTLRNLPGPVTAIGFFITDPAVPTNQVAQQKEAENLLKEYRNYSDKFTYRFVDPYANPLEARNYNLTRTGVIIFDNGTRRETATANSDQEFVSAILRLRQTGTKTIAVLDAAGSLADFTGANPGAAPLSLLKTELTNQNYQWLDKPYNVTISPTISVTDVTVLIVPPVDTAQPLSDAAVRAVSSYLDNGGHVLLLGDPLAAPMPTALLQKYGLREYHGAVLEQSLQNIWTLGGQAQPFNVAVSSYGTHKITEGMGTRTTYFTLAAAIQPPTSTITGFIVTPVVQSSAEAIMARFVTQNGQQGLEPDPSAPSGPLSLITAVEADLPATTSTITGTTQTTQTRQTRLVALGDVDFASDSIAQQLSGNNLTVATNIVNWLAQSEERITITSPTAAPNTLTLTADQQNLVFYSTVLFLPVLVLFLGGFVWWRRR